MTVPLDTCRKQRAHRISVFGMNKCHQHSQDVNDCLWKVCIWCKHNKESLELMVIPERQENPTLMLGLIEVVYLLPWTKIRLTSSMILITDDRRINITKFCESFQVSHRYIFIRLFILQNLSLFILLYKFFFLFVIYFVLAHPFFDYFIFLYKLWF